ncbi:MAG: DUF2029 domain-containing protein [Streptosporangiales bacterium]|nr:DUF2029 domain-containing protein [Streptosporangiales bacterium]
MAAAPDERPADERTGNGRPAVPVLFLVIVTLAVSALGFVEKQPCRAGGWNEPNFQYRHACYTDIYPLYFVRGLAEGKLPYLDESLEYPVLIGAVMAGTASALSGISDPLLRGRAFYDLNAALLTLSAVVTVIAVGYLAVRRPRDALMMAVAPGLALAAYINWDLLAVALSVLGLLAWSRRRHGWAGLLLGLAVATKFYPLVFFGPLFLLCLRAGRLRAFAVTTAAAVGGWLAVNLPVMAVAPGSWAEFYSFNRERGADWGSLWYLFQLTGIPALGTSDVSRINLMGTGAFLVCCAAIAVLALAAPRRPRLAQLLFLTLAAFLVTNKVWSPQYVLWLLPLVVLARPRWPTFLAWQAAEVGYFVAIWFYLLHVSVPEEGIGPGTYLPALALRAAAVTAIAVLVVRDVLRPDRDAVRADDADDPGGGVLDHAPDVVALRRRTRAVCV